MNGHTLLIVILISAHFISFSEQVRKRISDRFIRRAIRNLEQEERDHIGKPNKRRRRQYRHPAHKHGFLQSFDDALPPWDPNAAPAEPGIERNRQKIEANRAPNKFVRIPPKIVKEDRLQMAPPRELPLTRPQAPFRNPETAMYAHSPRKRIKNQQASTNRPLFSLDVPAVQVELLLTLLFLVL